MMQIKPVASADPNGLVRIARNHRWIPTTTLQRIQAVEEAYRFQTMNKVYDHGIYLTDFRPQISPPTIGSRRAVITAFNYEDRKESRSEHGQESRGHEFYKSRLRIQRRRNSRQADI